MTDIVIDNVKISPDHYINGERVSSEKKFKDYSPVDGRILGEISAGGQKEADMAVAAARAAFPAWAALGPTGRKAYLDKLAHIIEERVPDLALTETTDNGSLYEASLLRVMKRGAHNIHFFAEYALELEAGAFDIPHRNAHHRVQYKPAGVAVLITPWNAPFMLTTWKLGPALAAGNTVVIKPPEWAPLTNSLLADFCEEAGLPPGVVNVVQGIGEEAGAALTANPDVDRISFTGSPETARIIGKAAAENLTPVSFELGGKSPLIIFEDADMDLALELVLEQYDNAGQVCLAGTRILVQEAIADDLLEKIKQGAQELVQGDPFEAETFVGPLITQEHFDRVDGFVKRAINAGAELVYGGGPNTELGGLYYQPTLFKNAPAGSEILKKEVFGPVLTLQTFKDVDEAIEMANDTDYGLAAVVVTKSKETANRVEEEVTAGTVWTNAFYVRDLRAPFGGARNSGIGREGGMWSFDFFSDVKAIIHRKGTLA